MYLKYFYPIVIGLFTLGGVYVGHLLQMKSNKKERERVRQNFLFGIKDELSILLDIYKETVGNSLVNLPEGVPFLHFYHATDSYFSIYENNASLLPEIKNEKLRNEIIRVYSLSKSLLDSYRLNSQMVYEYRLSDTNFNVTNNAFFKSKSDMIKAELIRYAKYLKEKHLDLVKAIDVLKEKIN